MTIQSRTGELLRGFENAAFESNAVFRTILDAMAHPGRIYDLPLDLPAPAGLNKSATAFLLAMADMDTTIWLSPDCASDAANSFSASSPKLTKWCTMRQMRRLQVTTFPMLTSP